GLGISGASGFSVRAPAWALGAFVLGALIGGQICRRSGAHRGWALRNITVFKTVLAVPVTVLVLVTGEHLTYGVRTVVTVLLAASMGGQLALIRYLKVADLLTAVLTLTITGALTERGRNRYDPAVLRRGLAVLAFTTGVVEAEVNTAAGRSATVTRMFAHPDADTRRSHSYVPAYGDGAPDRECFN